jgi:hypothetical protein
MERSETSRIADSSDSPAKVRRGKARTGPAAAANPPEAKERVVGDFTWMTSHAQSAFKLEEMTVTLFRAANDAGGYKAYLTFSAYATSLGWSTNHALNYPDEGLYLFTKLGNEQGGILLQWDIPVVDIACGAHRVPVFFQKDNVDPDIYPLVSECAFGQAKSNSADRCR